MKQIFSFEHWAFLVTTLAGVAIVCIIVGIFFRKNKRVTWWTVMTILFLGLLFHFLRIVFPPPGAPYPYNIRYITLMSISASHTVLFPIFFLSKNKYLKDYMVYGGIFSGLCAIIFAPADILNQTLTGLGLVEVWRFFIAHGFLFAAPIIMLIGEHHKLNWRRAWTTGFILLGILCIILINDILLIATGIHQDDLAGLFDPRFRNTGMVYGPQTEDDIWSKVMVALTPDFLKTAPFDTSFGIMKGDKFLLPVLWAIPSALIFMSGGSILLGMIFDAKRFGRDMKVFWYTITFQKSKRIKYSKETKKLSTIRRF